MRIGDRSNRSKIDERTKHGTNKSGAPTGNSFFGAVEANEKAFTEYQLDLQELKDEIDQAGDALDNDPSLEQFYTFRDLIRALTKKVSDEAYRLRTIGVSMRNPQGLQIISTINSELDSLYRLIRTEHKDRISITNKVVRLKGLVVNVLS